MFSKFFNRKNSKKSDFVFDEFKSQIEKQGLYIDSIDESGLIHITQNELTLKISLDNIRRNYERDKDPSHISDFVQTLMTFSLEIPKDWSKVRDNIFVSLFPSDKDFEDFIHHPVTDRFDKIYVYNGENNLNWIRFQDIKEWNITEEMLIEQANINANKLLAETEIYIEEVNDHKLGLIECQNATLKGALLFASDIAEKVKNTFGFPFYAVIPVRDFCYIFSEKDFKFFSERLGAIVVEEYTKSGYPITTEILKFSDEGITSIGEYPIN